MAKTKSVRYVAAEPQEEYDEVDNFLDAEEQSAADEAALEPRCARCGELLAWHEEACAAGPQPLAPEAIGEELPVRPASGFAYELGHRVLPAPNAEPRIVTWRGQLKERHPGTGMVHRVPVYRLDDGYWDCYREEELQVA